MKLNKKKQKETIVESQEIVDKILIKKIQLNQTRNSVINNGEQKNLISGEDFEDQPFNPLYKKEEQVIFPEINLMTSIDDFVKKNQIKKIYRKPEELTRLEKL